MFNKIAQKNPSNVRSLRTQDEHKELEALKEQCEKLIEERKNCIVVRPTMEGQKKILTIHANSEKTKKDIDDKYFKLMEKLKFDYEMERLHCLRMFIQQELSILKGKGGVDFYVPIIPKE